MRYRLLMAAGSLLFVGPALAVHPGPLSRPAALHWPRGVSLMASLAQCLRGSPAR